MRETRGNGFDVVLIWCRVNLVLCLLWMCVCIVHDNGVELLAVSGWWRSKRESRKERVEKRRVKKVVWRKRASFCFCVTVSFHSILSPFQSTMPPIFFLRSHPLTYHSPHHTITYITPMCCPLSFFICDCQCTHSTLNTTQQRGHSAIVPTSLFRDCMVGTLSVALWQKPTNLIVNKKTQQHTVMQPSHGTTNGWCNE